VEKTPNQKWNEQISSYRNKCEKILTLSKSIRYVGLINEYGRTMTGILRPGLGRLLSAEPARNEFFLVSTLLSMRNKMSTALGMMDYVIFKHVRVLVVVFQRKEGIYYISINKNVPTSTVAQIILKIKKII